MEKLQQNPDIVLPINEVLSLRLNELLAGVRPAAYIEDDFEITLMAEDLGITSKELIPKLNSYFQSLGYECIQDKRVKKNFAVAKPITFKDFIQDHPIPLIPGFEDETKKYVAALAQTDMTIAQIVAEDIFEQTNNERDQCSSINRAYQIVFGALCGYKDCDISYWIQEVAVHKRSPFLGRDKSIIYDEHYHSYFPVPCPDCYEELLQTKPIQGENDTLSLPRNLWDSYGQRIETNWTEDVKAIWRVMDLLGDFGEEERRKKYRRKIS